MIIMTMRGRRRMIRMGDDDDYDKLATCISTFSTAVRQTQFDLVFLWF